jgi:hypothetical protein
MIILRKLQTNNRLDKLKERFSAKKESTSELQTGFAKIMNR